VSLQATATDLGIYGGTLMVCFIGGLVPIINAELWLVAIAISLASPAPLPLVVALAVIGQMAAKSLLYVGARGALDLARGRYQVAVARARGRVVAWRRKPLAVLWLSATVGLPPYYLIALVAGALGIRYRAFVLAGLVGRTLRFGTVVVVARTGWSLF
jgi:membrane protein YqaA with SNARE-associated domain